MRSILCIIDLTESSVAVLEVAAGMAHAYDAHVSILLPYRLIDVDHTGDASLLKASLEEKAWSYFLRLKREIVLLENVRSEFKPVIGFAGNVMTSHIRRNHTDVVVIGQSQANSITESNGITLQRIIQSLKLPIMIVPEEVKEGTVL
jgi:hypothetical protein